MNESFYLQQNLFRFFFRRLTFAPARFFFGIIMMKARWVLFARKMGARETLIIFALK